MGTKTYALKTWWAKTDKYNKERAYAAGACGEELSFYGICRLWKEWGVGW